ncbi:SDR family oxidoreductase [Pedobacter sp. UYP1]|uniref:SDR family NAD(P)-dependent oxidoreductase n=1 Tax=Pedobacter sp. UYP1 TaxID=1756396 RepID=UPI003390ED5C
MFSLSGKTFLVTGASSGIGQQIAISISNHGGRVIAAGRDMNRIQQTLTLLEGEGHSYHLFDLSDYKEIAEFVSKSEKLDGVVFNAGVIDYTPVKFINEEKMFKVFDVNFKGSVFLSQQLIKNKLINKMGSLVFISSISSKLGVPGTALYASSKAALTAYAKVVASELANQKIRANSISPGIIVTPMTEKAAEVVTDSSVKDAEKDYPLGYGTPLDVAGLAIYLLSDASRWMTGSDLILDGGLTLK